MTQPMEHRELAIKLAVHPVEGGGCTIVPDQEYNFAILNDDEIHMVRPLGEGEEMTLLLDLDPGSGRRIRALSFGTSSEKALEAPQTLDTGGDYYGDTPFRIAPGPTGSVFLTVVNDPHEHRYWNQLWYFDIWPEEGGPIHRIDPKIYNKGDDPPPSH